MVHLLRELRNIDRIGKLYLASQFLRALYFAWPIWYGFATLALTPLQVGIYFSILAITQVFAEVPTGAFADKFGRKNSALIGSIILTIVPLLMYFGHNFSAYLLSAFLLGVGGAFISGSLEALVYDHELVSKETYRTIVLLEITFFQTGLLVSAASGGFLYELHPSLPFVAETIACLATFFVVASMKEVRKKTSTEITSYITYFRDGLRFLFASKFLIVIVIMGVITEVMVYASIDFINEATMIEYGLPPTERGLLIAGAKVIALFVINIILLKVLRKDSIRLLYIAFLSTAIFAFLSVASFPIFLIGYMAFNWISATQSSFIRPIIHDHLPSSHRATAISGFSALIGLAAFGSVWFFGWLIQTYDTARAPYMLFTMIFIILIIPCAIWLAKHLQKDLVRT